jgi:hypothetical protein
MTKTYLTKAIAISTICIASVTSTIAFAPSAFAQYGLGLPKSAGTGGATRGNLPHITILAPDDGAKTLAARPTFYWYIAPIEISAPRLETNKNKFKVTFFLRDGNEKSSKRIFEAEGKVNDIGLYKFTLPENAPELVAGKVQRWQIRWQDGSTQVDVNAPIRRDNNPDALKAIAAAKNDLEKARIYADRSYWYDAINSYTIWLSQNPTDSVARTERNVILRKGLQNNIAFSQDQENQSSLAILIDKLSQSKDALAVTLQTKIRPLINR